MKMILNGYREKPQDRADVAIINPATKETVGKVYKAKREDGQIVAENAKKGFQLWSSTPLHQRTDIMMRAMEKMLEVKEEHATLLSKEMGKIYNEAMGEAVGRTNIGKGFIQRANHLYGKVLTDNQPGLEGDLIFTKREPLGVILCIVPFNFPLEMYAHKVFPALIMGNAVIIKVPSRNPLTLIEMTQILVDAGVPAEACQVIYADRDFVTEELIKTHRINAVSLTGSTASGIAIQRDSAPFLHRVFLELGGNDPLIICEDADIDYAVEQIYWGRVFNVGQTCCASKRFIVHESIHDELVEKLCKRLDTVKRGDPCDPTTEYGCIYCASAAKTLMKQVEDVIAQGAKCVYGGTIKDETFMEPTVLVDVTPDMDIAKDLEVFGPVIPIIKFKTVEEAIAIANASIYGLSAGIVTKDFALGLSIAKRLQSGSVVTNATGNYRHLDQPFGGYKKSGIGREGVSTTLEEFSQEKNYIIRGVF